MSLILPLKSLNAIAWTLFTVSTFLVFGRFYIRWTKTKRLYLDDIFNGLALVSLLIYLITYQLYLPLFYNYELFLLGLGGYMPTDHQLYIANLISIPNIVFFWVTIYCVKASFLSLYFVIFGVSKKFRMAWWAVAAYTFAAFLATFFAIFWSCGPPTKLTSVDACDTTSFQVIINFEVLWCVLNVVGDIMTMLLPLGMLRELRISTAQKFGLAAVTSLVFIDIAFDIVRTLTTLGAVTGEFINANDVWILCELNIAVMVCALPIYRSLINRKKHTTSTSYEELGRAKASAGSKSRTTVRTYEMDTFDQGSETALRVPEASYAAQSLKS